MIEYGILFIAWILVLYVVPFVYVRILDSVHVYDFHGALLLMVPTTLIFPVFLLSSASRDTALAGAAVLLFPSLIILLLWWFLTEGLDFGDNFLSSIITIYIPTTVAMLLLLLLGVFEFLADKFGLIESIAQQRDYDISPEFSFPPATARSTPS